MATRSKNGIPNANPTFLFLIPLAFALVFEQDEPMILFQKNTNRSYSKEILVNYVRRQKNVQMYMRRLRQRF